MELNVYSTFNNINLWCNFSDLTGILVGINLSSYEQLSVYTCVCVCVFLCVCFNIDCTGPTAGGRRDSPQAPKT